MTQGDANVVFNSALQEIRERAGKKGQTHITPGK